MRNFIVFILFLNIAIGEDKILGNFFKDCNTSGTFIVFDGKNYASNDFQRAKQAFSPASTFKIFNALIALDNGVVRDTKEIFYHYKGEKVFLPSWKQDASLSSAIKRSQVPAFKELARKIGLKTMQEGLNKLSYGNTKISKSIPFGSIILYKFLQKIKLICFLNFRKILYLFPKKVKKKLKKLFFLRKIKSKKFMLKQVLMIISI